MDQVKESLAVAIKYAFWIGSAIILIGTVTVWYMSTSDLTTQTDSQIRGIETDVSKVSQYRSELSTQPNELSHQKMQEMIDSRKQEVLQAWQTVFDAQRDILTWPDILQDEFLDEFKYAKDPETGVVDRNKLKLPFEVYEPFPPPEDDRVPPFLLRRYEDYIHLVLPNYAAIAGAEWTADFKASRGGGLGMMGGMGMDDMMMMGGGAAGRQVNVDITGATDEPVVVWTRSSQDALLKDLFPWKGAKEYPSELDVYYSQENLWILRQLLQIVAAVNGDAQQAFEAEIREIKTISIGRSVTFTEGQISDPGSRVTAGFGGMDDLGYEDMEMGMESDYSMDPSSGGGSSDDPGTDPGDGRYVNTALEPIDASTLRGAFSSNDPGQVAIAVAKRVPVMMRFQMHQRSVTRLLAACGSAPLMVDVRQVRMMPKGGLSSDGGMGGGGYGDMSGYEGMEDEMMGGGMGMGMGGGGAMMVDQNEEFPMDMDVEIYGLIYFYNPPSEEALGIEKVKDDVNIDESAEVVDSLPDPVTTPPATDTTPPADTSTTPDPATTPAPTPAVPTTPAPTATPPADPSAGTPAPTGTPAPAGTPAPTGTPAPAGTPAPTGTPAPAGTPAPTTGTPAPTGTPSPTTVP